MNFADLKNVFSSILIDQINHVKHHDIVYCDTDSTVEEALNIITENNILCVPVQLKNKKDIVGMVDVNDIVSYILSLVNNAVVKNSNSPNSSPTPAQANPSYYEKLKAASTKFSLQTVSKAIDASNRDHHCTVFGGAPLIQLLEIFGRGLHRVSVYDEDETKITKLVSQSDVIRYIIENQNTKEIMKPLLSKTLDEVAMNDPELNFGRESPLTVLESDIAIEAYTRANNSRISAVGVLDHNGDLIGNFSASDIKGLNSKSLTDLSLPIKDFFEKHKSNNIITVTVNSTLLEVIEKCNTNMIHRVWVVEKENLLKPLGVITLTDIMNIFSFYSR